tara:strand:- start:271 stop:477 length:207 start_codon:yes stop_codon:yes gene_type:complete
MKHKKVKDYREITIEESMQWIDHNCYLDDVRKRLKSRAVAYKVGTYLLMAMGHIEELEKEIKILKGEV